MDFIAFDFETATAELNSACSIGFTFVNNLEVVGGEYFLIKPPSLAFDEQNIAIHGITPAMVENQPPFPAVWARIRDYFNGRNILVAHNASFDMSVLHKTLDYYSLPKPNFPYACSMELSDGVCGRGVRKGLAARAAYFNIDMGTHHNAQDDALTCAQIVLSSIRASGLSSILTLMAANAIAPKDFARLKPQNPFAAAAAKPAKTYHSFETLDIKAVNETPVEKETVFTGKSVVLTGNFGAYSKTQLATLLVSWGATIKSGVSRKTDLLLVGAQDKSLVGEGGVSTKEAKARELMAEGHHIQVMTEKEFLVMAEAIKAM